VGTRKDCGEVPAGLFSKQQRQASFDEPIPLRELIQHPSELSEADKEETKLLPPQIQCIEHWNRFVKAYPSNEKLPSFPIWGMELLAREYPFEEYTPWSMRDHEPRWADEIPSYAQTESDEFPKWKKQFIRHNRAFFDSHSGIVESLPQWEQNLSSMKSCYQKLEWNCKGAERDLWKHVLQFRPSGLRVRHYDRSPALIAMTATQIPVVGENSTDKRFLTVTEGLRIQGFEVNETAQSMNMVGLSRVRAFKALGNAVHVGVVKFVAEALLATAKKDRQEPSYGVSTAQQM
jgi:DNA (cytosine-5)-methyltransferase 1